MNIFKNLGSINSDMGNYQEAQQKLNQSSEIAERINDKELKIISLINLGRLFEKLNLKTEAEKTLNEAEKLSSSLNDKRSLLTIHQILSRIKWKSEKNGKEALKLLKETKEKPDLILLDMFMPEMSGREVCERIRKDDELKNLKVAFLTVAAFRDQGKQMLKDLNVLDYILKPFDNDDLINRIKKLVD